mgnify:CR=1 FL=1|tara:strand:- start:2717 stop:3280 length:564 start_codon:yes stop_codon:yes gene_type:complete
MKTTQVTPEESFLLQSHALVECVANLQKMEVTNDPDFRDLKIKVYGQTATIMTQGGGTVFGGQGALISAFYTFLVLPLEWKRRRVGSFEKLDLSEPEKIANSRAEVGPNGDTYPRKNQALRHFRNALAHARIGWSSGGKLIVEDSDPSSNAKYIAEYSMESLGELLQSLNMAIAIYVDEEIKPRKLK